jgi:hypothetical protein
MPVDMIHCCTRHGGKVEIISDDKIPRVKLSIRGKSFVIIRAPIKMSIFSIDIPYNKVHFAM